MRARRCVTSILVLAVGPHASGQQTAALFSGVDAEATAEWGEPDGLHAGRAALARRNFAAASPRSAQAIEAGLDWIVRQQGADGGWPAASDRGARPVGATALALLALLGDSHDPVSGRHRDVIRNGLRWLVAQLDGDAERSRSEHALATLALVEATRHAPFPALRAATVRRLRQLAERDPDDGWSFLVWMQAREAGLWSEPQQTSTGLELDPEHAGFGGSLLPLCFAGGAGRPRVPAPRAAAALEELAAADLGRRFLAATALHQIGSSTWARARKAIVGAVDEQADDGAWEEVDAAPSVRVRATALHLLTLQTPYRLIRLRRR